MTTNILEIRDLVKTYIQGETPIPVLSGLNLDVNKGETVAIIGQSGAGKSTLLSLMAGLDRPTSGRVAIAGSDITILDELALARFRGESLGIVFQQFHLMSSLTALENVALPLEINGTSDAEERAKEALDLVGLASRLDHLPHMLSGGECQRVAIARALVVRPKVLLADEPSGNLDDATGKSVMELLFDLVRSTEMTMVLVTHNTELASRCDRKLRLAQGVLQQ